jgi:Na+/H+-dicarboxylate symporter
MTLAVQVLVALVAGFLVGLALAATSSPLAALALAILGPLGTVFVNLIRMTAVPLVVSMLVAGVGRMKWTGELGRVGVRAILTSIALLVAAAVLSAFIAQFAFARIPIDQAAALALRGSGTPPQTTPAASGVSGVTQWLLSLVPPNVVQAAAAGDMVPVILAAVFFGLALTRIHDTRRDALLRIVEGIAAAMQQVVVWVLRVAPIGVFALAAALAARLGLAAAAAVIAYVAVVVVLTVAASALLLYPLGVIGGRMGLPRFVAFCAPAQTIAFASRSSLATLPVMVESAERAHLPPAAARVVLPLALAIFHFGAAIAQTVGVIFLARLYGVTLTPPQIAAIIVAVVFASFAVPGIPGGSIIAMVPVLSAANLPVEGIAILLAVDTIPDMFRTTANVTGAMTLTAIMAVRQSDSSE